MNAPELPPIFARHRRLLFIRLVINGILQALAIIGSMLLVRHAFNVLLNPAYDDPEVNLYELTDVWQIVWLAVGLLVCTGFAAWLRWLERVDAEKLGQDYVHRVRLLLFDRMRRFAPRAMSRRTTGAAMLRFVGDLNSLRRWVSLGLARIVVSAVVTVIALGFLSWLDPSLAGVSLLLLALGLLWNIRLGPRLHGVISEARRRRGRLAGNINEKIRSFAVIQAFDQGARERRRFGRHSLRLREAMIDRARASGRMRVVTDGATAACMGLVLSLGAYQVFRGMTTSGNVVAAMTVVGFLSSAFRDLGRVNEYHQSARVSTEKILSFMRTRTLKGRSSRLPPLRLEAGRIELRDLVLGDYLRGISAVAEGGSRVALVGDNGAGKSTLLHVVARLIDPDSGTVLIDGQDIARCLLSSVRQVFGLISPDLPLMRGSVRYNLRYRCPDAPAEEVARVSRLCGLDELLQALPGGEDYRVQEGGSNLSLGQRHRLAIARALLGRPGILIIDEIDANLDPDAAAVLDRVLEDFAGTVMMVTRNPARLARADQRWYLQQGRLVRIEKQDRASGSLVSLNQNP
ncbi:ABC transporter ATP-binding protein [Geothermobacter hydrogeniphilus]|uniref:ATP-binding cassette, subfamily B n=1 Tax=Geothermobacter hydrogeniphilus TaxID=1969733 RepID=A0A1X0YAN0_9BACT|nr:ABC transporter ATP-binding protein [Geothermobacter hydrogeniphilus]ORJ62177.1 hypothetical protein B5V00_05370 [Geothermobacter hydrogeniphilus]